uniref:Angiopoietin-related protein 4 isoform X2 n=1 Tax=Pogona vitticeps TaxID=103695 RepID=A0ABM5ELV0_9SAUR
MPRLAALLLALAAACAPAGASPSLARPPKERARGPPSALSAAGSGSSAKAASWDEVNLLAHAVLQLGHGLKEHVDRAGGQVRDLRARLAAHEAALARLESSADGAQQQQRPPPARAPRRRDEPEEPEAGAGSPGGPAAGNASRGAPADLAALQNLVGLQNSKIEELFQKVKQQQYRMDKQNLQIKSLQSKVNMMLPLYAKGNEMEKNPKQKMDVRWSPDSAANRSHGAGSTLPEAPKFPLGCHQLFLDGSPSNGVVRIQPPGAQPFDVLCDATPGGGGWTVIQKRQDGSVDFDQLWEAYKTGFGNMSGDFWLGLEKTHQIMRDGRFHLLIELQDWEGNAQTVQFLFSLGGEETAYTLSLLGPILGELENAMGDFPQLPFSTRDRDHDLKGDANCAKHLSGGWWFSTCGHVNLNGRYFRSIPRQRHDRKQGIFWKTWRGRYYPLRSTVMKIRPVELGQGA